MLSPQEDVERALQQSDGGPIVDLDYLPDSDIKNLFVRLLGNALIRVFINSNGETEIWRKTFVWISMDSSRNAKAIITGTYKHIVINDGLIEQMIYDAYRVAHDEGIFPWFGSDSSALPMLGSQSDKGSSSSEPPLESLARYAVSAGPRQQLSLMILTLSFLFVVDHEYCHLVNHHGSSSPLGVMTPHEPANPGDHLTLQAREMDADTYAINRWADMLLGRDNFLNKCDFSNIISVFQDQDRVATYTLFTYAMFCAFRGLGQERWAASFPSTSRHPPAPFRFKVALGVLWEKLEKFGSPLDRAAYIRLLESIWPFLEFLYTRNTETPPRLSSLDEVSSPEATQHFMALYQRWCEPQSSPHSG